MWYLKYKYKHSDCIYADKLQKLCLNGYFFYFGEYIKGNFVYTSNLIQIIGEEKNIKKYISYLKNHKNIVKCEAYGNLVFTLAKHKKKLVLYAAVYNPVLLYPAPTYLNKEGFEITEIACWDRKPLQDIITCLEKNETTEHFEILQFKQRKIDDIYVSKLLPKLPEKQKQAITLAFKNGYYNFPRKINLDKLARMLRVSKQTFRENLRKAEAKIIPKFISE